MSLIPSLLSKSRPLISFSVARSLESFVCNASALGTVRPHAFRSNLLTPISLAFNNIHSKYFMTSSPDFLKEIHEEMQGEKLVIEAKYVDSPHSDLLVDNCLAGDNVCPLCALNLNIKHTDVLLLSQFVRPNGLILPRRITGLCTSQQYKITRLILMAKKAGLMPNLAPDNSHKDPYKRRGSKKLHRYFDEHTISDTRVRNIAYYRPIHYFKPGVRRQTQPRTRF